MFGKRIIKTILVIIVALAMLLNQFPGISFLDIPAGVQDASAVISYEQEGFRFRNDDGSETTATWLAVQDTDVTQPSDTNTRLRMLVNATDDPPSNQYQLEYKLSTDSEYAKVLTTAGDGDYSTITFVNSSNDERGGGGGGALSPVIPTNTTEDDFMIAFCIRGGNGSSEVWDDDGGGGNSWTRLDNQYTSAGRDIESAIFYKVAGSSESTPTFTHGGSFPISCSITSLRGVDTTTPFDVTYSSSSHFTSGEDDGTPDAPDITTNTDGAVVVTMSGINFGNITAGGAPTNYTLRVDVNQVNRNNHVATRTITSSGSDSIGSWTHTGGGTQEEYHTYTLAVRPAAPTGTPVYVATSSNISASGENTTAQLTAPSGKTTGDFVTGRMQDDENPADSINITTDDYTELEWNLQASSTYVSDTEVYQFRVTIDGTALDTYTVTPEWTIGTPEPTFTQNTYRFYVDNDGTNPTEVWGIPDLAENMSITTVPAGKDPPNSTQEVRLRINLTVNTNPLSTSSQQFKLQYKVGTDGSCTSGIWVDIGGGVAWTFATSSVTDGADITGSLSTTDVSQEYAKSNPTQTNHNSATAGQNIEYDFHIVGTNTNSNTQYSFRLVESDNTILDAYTNCPTLVTEPGTGDLLRHGQVFTEGSEQGFFWVD